MKIKKITLENIRSYEKEEIIFNKGATLLAGDIGSGKTSILLGIEFALFGLQPGQRGISILRNGKDWAKVVLEFELDEKIVIIERTLKKGKTITQDYCAITINGEKEELSVTEIKDKILSLLNYPKEFARKQNLLYKFTVYTPQEEMKQIVLEEPQARLNTLRHVFGVDKYKIIIENISIVTSKLREEKRIKQAMILNLESEKEAVEKKKNEIQQKTEINEIFIKILHAKKMKEKKLKVKKRIWRTKLKRQILF